MNKHPELDERDWFAGNALIGLLAFPGDDETSSWHSLANQDKVAEAAYLYADAMMKRRMKNPANSAVDTINSIIESAPKHPASNSRQGSRNTFT